MDNLNRFHTRTTYWIVRGENIALLLILSGLLLWRAGEVHWWRFLAAFWIIDFVGYIPGAIAYRCSKTKEISRWYYNTYNIAHTYLVTGTGVALWAYAIGGFEWAMLGVPIHLCVDRGVFGNTLKPVELSFEPRRHPDEVVLRALGQSEESRSREATGASKDGSAIEEFIPKDVLTDVLEHPSGYLALSRRNRVFVNADHPGVHLLPQARETPLALRRRARPAGPCRRAARSLPRLRGGEALPRGGGPGPRVAGGPVRQPGIHGQPARDHVRRVPEGLQPRRRGEDAAPQQDPEGPKARAEGGRAGQGCPPRRHLVRQARRDQQALARGQGQEGAGFHGRRDRRPR